MAFLSKLFGKKDREDKNEKIEEVVEASEDYEGDLTDEEIEAAERLEAENREEYENATSLDYDGEFVDYEGIDDGEDEEEDDEEEKLFKYNLLVLLAEVMKADGKLKSRELDSVKSTIRRYYRSESKQKAALKQFQLILKTRYHP